MFPTCIIQGLDLDPWCSSLILLGTNPISLDTRDQIEILSQVIFLLHDILINTILL